MSLINCKDELILKWTKHCVSAAPGNDNINNKTKNIIFTIEDTRLYIPVVIFLAKNNQKLS